ncbi:DUF2199 domain-containing protein [Kibdelosporangium philippinense]|uniref:DUF2199 domain-containing protein n=1 Tax=Kibdelosporangium philippinense TaxID=211113 RepID=A0ABS8Z7H6_9PSEU|nr:DUF2199 domain-containing protein [Kibdelosporangium philippinense]MCE7003841.1 DUF2199 domain-containing protein [Kibdelosporangium philippinense]
MTEWILDEELPRCGCCGDLMDTADQIDFAFDMPDVAHEPDAEVEEVTSRLVRVRGAGGFVRCVMPVALTGDVRLWLGVWVRVSDTDFDYVVTVWSKEEYRELAVQGTLANLVMPWGYEIREAPLTATVREASQLPHADTSEHPMLHRVLTEVWNRDAVLSRFADAVPVSFREHIGDHWAIERSSGLSARKVGRTVEFSSRFRTVLIDQFNDEAGRSVDEFLKVILAGGPEGRRCRTSRCLWSARVTSFGTRGGWRPL